MFYEISPNINKVVCTFPMVISPEFHMGQYWDDDHREDAPFEAFKWNEHDTTKTKPSKCYRNFKAKL